MLYNMLDGLYRANVALVVVGNSVWNCIIHLSSIFDEMFFVNILCVMYV